MTFSDFARANGVLIPRLYADGRIHRVPTVAHPRSRNGAYKFTGEWGWVQAWEEHAAPIVYQVDGACAETIRRDLAQLHRQERATRARAARTARDVLARCEFGPHPYLARKGFPDEHALLDGERMVVPMRSVYAYRQINSVQWISADGDKKFFPGGAARESVFKIGAGNETWLCEGYATALSVRKALTSLYRQACVVVCFSAGNLVPVARALPTAFVAADHDVSGAGEKYARETGLPWAMPDEPGDFNDLHQKRGIDAVAERLRNVTSA